MNGAPTAGHAASGKEKPVYGKKGNVGGKMTPGRPGSLKMAMAMKNLVAPGAGTKKIAGVSNLTRPEGAVKINVGPKGGSGSASKMVAGSPKSISVGSGHKGIQVGTRPEGAIKRDASGAVKPSSMVK